jgi:sigma-B regulation protein RsbU (phosphoserine phosphatase)
MLPGTNGTVLAALAETTYAAAKTTLRPGDGLFLYTDGVTEAMNLAGDIFGDEQLRLLLATQASASSEAVVQRAVYEVRVHAAAAAQSDDVTALMVKYNG